MSAGNDPASLSALPGVAEAKQRAYAAQRRRHTEAWFRRLAGLADEPTDAEAAVPAGEPPPGKSRTRARGQVHDPRQSRLDV